MKKAILLSMVANILCCYPAFCMKKANPSNTPTTPKSGTSTPSGNQNFTKAVDEILRPLTEIHEKVSEFDQNTNLETVNQYLTDFKEKLAEICSNNKLTVDDYNQNLPTKYNNISEADIKGFQQNIKTTAANLTNDLSKKIQIDKLTLTSTQLITAIQKKFFNDANNDLTTFKDIINQICITNSLENDYTSKLPEQITKSRNTTDLQNTIRDISNKLIKALTQKKDVMEASLKLQGLAKKFSLHKQIFEPLTAFNTEHSNREKKKKETLTNIIQKTDQRNKKYLSTKLHQWHDKVKTLTNAEKEAAAAASNELLQMAEFHRMHDDIVENASLDNFDNFKKSISDNFQDAGSAYYDAISNRILAKLGDSDDLSFQSCITADTTGELINLDNENNKNIADNFNNKTNAIYKEINEEKTKFNNYLNKIDKQLSQDLEDTDPLVKKCNTLFDKYDEITKEKLKNATFQDLFVHLECLKFLNREAEKLLEEVEKKFKNPNPEENEEKNEDEEFKQETPPLTGDNYSDIISGEIERILDKCSNNLSDSPQDRINDDRYNYFDKLIAQLQSELKNVSSAEGYVKILKRAIRLSDTIKNEAGKQLKKKKGISPEFRRAVSKTNSPNLEELLPKRSSTSNSLPRIENPKLKTKKTTSQSKITTTPKTTNDKKKEEEETPSGNTLQ